MTRDILNHLGAKIGELTLPDNTSEEVWAEKLSVFSREEAAPTMEVVIGSKIEQYKKLSDAIIEEIKVSNTMNGITNEESAQLFNEYASIILALKEGAFPTVVYMLEQKTPSGFMTQDRINAVKDLISKYV